MSTQTVSVRSSSGKGVAAARAATTTRAKGSAPAARPVARPTAKPGLAVVARPTPERISTARFALVVVAVVLGGLGASLALNTALGSGAFELATLQQRHADLMDAQQQAAQRLATLETPASLAVRAHALGMIPATGPAFLTIKSGALVGTGIPGNLARGSQPISRPIVPARRALVPAIVVPVAHPAKPSKTPLSASGSVDAPAKAAALAAASVAAVRHLAVKPAAHTHKPVIVHLPVRSTKSGSKSGR